MESETTKFLNNLYPYFKMLDNINNGLTKVIRSNKDNDPYQNEELFYNITSELLRILPYKYNEKDKSIIKVVYYYLLIKLIILKINIKKF